MFNPFAADALDSSIAHALRLAARARAAPFAPCGILDGVPFPPPPPASRPHAEPPIGVATRRRARRLDLVVLNSAGPDGLFLGDGTGGFAYDPALGTSSEFTASALIADLDGDQDADLLVGARAQDRLYLGGPTGLAPIPASLPFDELDSEEPALGDVNADGSPDAFLARLGTQDRVLANLGVQLARRGPVQLGVPLDLELHGAPGALAFPALSAGTAAVPFPGIAGELGLDPAALLLLPPVLLDGQGAGVGTLGVPSVPTPAP